MGDFKRSGGFGGNRNRGGFSDRSGGRPGFGGGHRPSFGNRDERRSEMFTATCDQCHKQCEVPFRPSGSKPVYCNDCFSSKKEDRGSDFDRREAPRKHFERDDGFSLDTAPKPRVEDKRLDELKRQIDGISAKLDKLLHLAQGNNPTTHTPPVSTVPTKTSPPTTTPKTVVTKPASARVKTVKKEVRKAPAKKKETRKKK